MVFSSLGFIFQFLPIFLIVYFAVNEKYRNYVLIAGSLVFYAIGEPLFVGAEIAVVLINFFFARRITYAHARALRRGDYGKGAGKVWLFCGIGFNLGILFIFKYLGMLIDVSIILPIGISFFIFQNIAYIVDVYRLKYIAKRNITDWLVFAFMFPKALQGPLSDYGKLERQINVRSVNMSGIESGALTFAAGLALKVLLSDNIQSLWNDVFSAGPCGIDTGSAWLGAWGFSMKIYFDFFGYSLMAKGLGEILGFSLPDNFDNPYAAKSVSSFWRKWHITLGSWFKNYIYIPLGGSRQGRGRMVVALFAVALCTGIWHGGTANFLIWGAVMFIFLLLEKFFYGKKLEKSRVVGRIYMLVLIPVTWMIFGQQDVSQLFDFLKRMFFIPVDGGSVQTGLFGTLFCKYWWLLLICAIFATPYPMRLFNRFKGKLICKAVLLALFILSVVMVACGGTNPFLYLRF